MKKIFPHVFVAISFIILLAMGTWQVHRLEWKTALIKKVNTRLHEKPIALADYKNADEDEYRQITLTGTYDYAHEMQIMGRPFNGKPGIYVITPMQTNDKTGSKTILVNRGWAKYDESYGKPEGAVTAIGIIRKTQERNWLNRHIIQDNVPAKNLWFYADLPQMYAHANAPRQDFYVEIVADTTPNSYPYALPKEINLYNEHLTYAITWYSLAFALLLTYYFRFHRR